MTCTKCNGCLEWEYNGLDHNLKCINCSRRYYDVLPANPLDVLLAELKSAQTQRRAA
jgi:hypothetical protein